ncbi:MAG: ribonuclease P [Archaeoglobaceae archaeon]|nr:ribonuclease P [Archaeoglobaceae archaeon]MDW8014352.1 Rpp14/Pop5 family protein [Archaeoglobaceae archaeon]
MRGLPPSLRSRKRYIAFKVVCEVEVDGKMIEKALEAKMAELFGDIALAESKISLEYFNDNKGILGCERKSFDKVLIALTFLTEINGFKVLPITVGASGNVRKCKKKYLEVL